MKMKLMSLLVTATFVSGSMAQANARVSNIQCRGFAYHRDVNRTSPIDILVTNQGGQAVMTVSLDHRIVFDSIPVDVRSLPDRIQVLSSKLINRNDVPSYLRLQVWNGGAEFSEGSYLPEIPSSQITCSIRFASTT